MTKNGDKDISKAVNIFHNKDSLFLVLDSLHGHP